MRKLFFATLGLVMAFGTWGAISIAKAASGQPLEQKVFVGYYFQRKAPRPQVSPDGYRGPQGYGQPTQNCSVTSNDKVVDFSKTNWNMPAQGLNYKINYNSKPSNITNDQFKAAVETGFATWHKADSKEIFNDVGKTTINSAKKDGTSTISFGTTPSGSLGVTYGWFDPKTKVLSEADTIFNKDMKWSFSPDGPDCGGIANTFDLQDIATHEFGHWVGLGDLYNNKDKDLTMFGYSDMGEMKKNSLGAGDIKGAQTIAP